MNVYKVRMRQRRYKPTDVGMFPYWESKECWLTCSTAARAAEVAAEQHPDWTIDSVTDCGEA